MCVCDTLSIFICGLIIRDMQQEKYRKRDERWLTDNTVKSMTIPGQRGFENRAIRRNVATVLAVTFALVLGTQIPEIFHSIAVAAHNPESDPQVPDHTPTHNPTSTPDHNPTPTAGISHPENVSSTGVDVSWLWQASNDGSFHHNPITSPPVGNDLHGAANIHISTNYDNHVIGEPTISCQEFVDFLHKMGSPMYKDGHAAEVWYTLYLHGVDPRFALAIFMAESRAGVDPAWIAAPTGNFGNNLYAQGLPGIPDQHYVPFDPHTGYVYTDFRPYGDMKWNVAADGMAGLLKHPLYASRDDNNAAEAAKIWVGPDPDGSYPRNVLFWMDPKNTKELAYG